MVAVAAARRVAASYGDRIAAVRTGAARAVDQQWQRLDSWRDADIRRFASAVAPIVEAAQLSIANLTDAYFAGYEAAALGRSTRPVGVRPSLITGGAIRGVPTAEVYSRAGPVVWEALSLGYAVEEGVSKARARLQSIVATDMQLAKVHAARAIMTSKPNIVGYRRVTRGTCDLCIRSTHKTYAVDVTMPIHPGCNCDLAPRYADVQDFTPRNREQQEDPAVRVEERRHGELGLLLVNAAYAFSRLGDTKPRQTVTGHFGTEAEEAETVEPDS